MVDQDDQKLEQLYQYLAASSHAVFFGGAGVSVASGIPDFRSSQGLYTRFGDNVLSHTYLLEHPQQFYDFYFKHLYAPLAQPNITHWTLRDLQQAGMMQEIITQNIDGLHQLAGNKNVIELHGNTAGYSCLVCHKHYDATILNPPELPHCTCGGLLRPDVVLFEEALDPRAIQKAVQAIARADVLIVAGTSLQVYPAAGFVQEFRGNHLVLINKDETPLDSQADLVFHQPMETVFAAIRSRLSLPQV